MKAIIFNSGLGSRIGEFTKEHHKSMIPLKDGESIFHRQLRLLYEEGIREAVVTIGPFAEQLRKVAEEFPEMKFSFVPNPIYDKTNYIYSMYLAREEMDDDMIFLHGDLVFSRRLLHDVLNSKEKDLGTVNFKKALPEKDFKCRVKEGNITEVSIHIFDSDCYAFQPMYKLSKEVVAKWNEKVREFIEKGEDRCYAENALNEILPSLSVKPFSYEEYFIDEIDNLEDHARVTEEILSFDKADKEFFN